MQIGFSAEQWRKVREDYTAFWRGELDRALIYLTRWKPSTGKDYSRLMSNWPLDLSDNEIISIVRDKFARQIYYGDAFPYFMIDYGPGVGAAFLGSRLHAAPSTAWFEPVAHKSLSDIRIAVDPENSWWRLVKRVTKCLAEAVGPNVQIAMTDIGGNLDILASLRGTDNLLADLMDQPGEVHRCLREITKAWLAIYDELHRLIEPYCPGSVAWAPVWAPDRSYMLQSDFSFMISPAHFREFAVPDIKACCDSLKYSFYHLDGDGQLNHLDQLLAIENLHGIQWVPGAGKPNVAEWDDVLAKIRDAGKLNQIYTTREGALRVVKRLGGKGFVICIESDQMSDASARRFVKEFLAAQRPGRKRKGAQKA